MAPPRAPERLRFTPRSVVVAVLLVGLALAVLGVLAASRRVLGWTAVAAAMAAVLYPLPRRLSRHMPRGLAVGLVAVVALLAVGGTTYGVVNELVAQTRSLQRAAPRRAAEIERSSRFAEAAREVRLAERTQRFVEEVPDRLRGGTPAEAVRAATTRGVAFLATAVLTLFLMLHGPALAAGAARQIHDPRRRALAGRLALAAYRDGIGYVRATMAMALAAGVFAYLVGVRAGVPGPLPLALWVALWDVVPILGAVVGGLPLVALAAAGSPTRGLVVAGAFVAYEVFESVVVQRRIERGTVRVGPFLTAAGGFAGLELYGLGGALLMVLALALAAAVARELSPADVQPAATSTQAAERVPGS